MTEAENQAKQLDSVTDRVEEQEVDSTKAMNALGALATPAAHAQASNVAIAVAPEDIQIICDELEVTEEVATRTLRQVAQENKQEGESMVAAALRKLITTWTRQDKQTWTTIENYRTHQNNSKATLQYRKSVGPTEQNPQVLYWFIKVQDSSALHDPLLICHFREPCLLAEDYYLSCIFAIVLVLDQQQ